VQIIPVIHTVHFCFGEFGPEGAYKFGLADKKIKKNGIPEKKNRLYSSYNAVAAKIL
jgi:hypothetical protein